MANIVNERDLLLQNSTQRAVDVTLPSNVVPPALKAVTLAAPSTTFRVATDNSSSPSAITLNASLRAISGTPTMTWSVTPAGAATLTGSTYGVRTLTYANMAQDYCTVRVEVNDGGMIYFDEMSFAKVRDGSKGVDGRRGSISTAKAVAGSTWSDAQALQALVDLGISTPLATDTVTLFNASTSYAEMRRYSGTAWVAVDSNLPGSLLMDGSLGLTKFASGVEPVKVVSTLPTTKSSNTVFLTSDSKLYRWNGTAYTKAVDGADIEANSITAGQIAAGAIKTDELDALAVTAAKIATGAVTADKVTAGAITTEKLLVTGLGIALNPDPNTQDLSAWTGTGLSIVTDTTSPSGSTALECTGLGATVLTSKFPVDPTKNYKARIWTKQQSGTSTTYLTVAFYDATGTRISGTSNGAGWPGKGTFHYFGLVNGALPAAWSEYSISFGPGESAVLPSNARFMAIGVLSNYTGTGVQRVAAPLVHLKTTGDMVVDGTLTASKIDTRGLSIKDASGNVILAAGSALDWGMVGGSNKPADGATRNEIYSSNTAPSYTFVGSLWLCTADAQTYKAIGTVSPDVAVISAGQFINCTSLASSQDIIVLPFGSNEAVFSGLSSGTLVITNNTPSVLTGAIVSHSLNTGMIAYKDFVYFTNGYTTTTDIAKYMTDGTPFSLTAYSTAPANTANIFALASYKKDVIYRATGSSWEAYSTMGAPTGTYVGGTLAQDVESQASAQSRADAAANWAVSTAQIYAEAQANLATINAQAYADGVITAAEQRAIDAATEKANAAKADAINAAAADAKAKADVAATTAYWSGVSGIGKPADSATNGSNLVRKPTFGNDSVGSWANGVKMPTVDVAGGPLAGYGEIRCYERDTYGGHLILVTPGETLFCSGFVWSGLSTYGGSIGVGFKNAAGNFFDWRGAGYGAGQEWHRVSAAVVVPDGAVSAEPWLQIGSDNGVIVPYVAFSDIYVGRQERGATVGMLSAESSTAYTASNGWSINKDGSFSAIGGGNKILVGTDRAVINFNKPDGTTAFAVDNTGSAVFGGSLLGATGTFSGALSAGVVDSSVFDSIRYEYQNTGSFSLTVPNKKAGWTKMSMRITIQAAGGGGGGGSATYDSAAHPASTGGGGGAGQKVIYLLTTGFNPGDAVNLVVGAGGAGGSVSATYAYKNSVTANPGQSGGASTVTVGSQSMTAAGGIGGGAGTYTLGMNFLGGAGGSLGGVSGTGGRYISALGGRGGSSEYSLGGLGGEASIAAINSGGIGGIGAGGGGGGASGEAIYQKYGSSGGKGGNGYILIEFFDPNTLVLNSRYDALIQWLDGIGHGAVPSAAR